MVSSAAPLSARSVTRVCRLSCQRPLTPAFFRTLLHDVFKVTMGRVGSLGRGLPNGNTYHSGRIVPKRLVYHFAYSTIATSKAEFIGILRPSPASVLLSPTVKTAFARSTRSH